MNTYGYVFNNPLYWSDFYGLAPGDLFKSPDDAAIDAGNYARSQGNQTIEYGGWIYKDGDCYTYNSVQGTKYRVPRDRLDLIRPYGNSDVAVWHTHPITGSPGIDNGNENFSGDPYNLNGDIGFAHDVDRPIYLRTPSDMTKVYDPDTGNSRTLPYGKQPESCTCKANQ